MQQQPMQQGQPTVIYVTTSPVAPAPIQANTKWRNRPQTNATASASFIFVSGGMNLALGVGWNQGTFFGSSLQFSYSWFIAVIAGTLLSLPLRYFLPKKIIMGFSSLLVLVGGILFTSDPYNYNTTLAARYINGIAIGLAIIPFLMNASEIADIGYRGACLSVEQYSISLGIAIQMIYASYWDPNVDFAANRLHGILDIIYALLALVSVMTIVESPVDQIRKGNDTAALETLARLRRPAYVTVETQALLEQHKSYVREEENLTLTESFSRGFLPLIKLLLLRSMMLTFCFSIPLNMSIYFSSTITNYSWAPTVSGIFRLLGGFIGILMVDNSNRKMASIFPLAAIGCFLIGLGSLFQSTTNMSNYDDMVSSVYLYMFLQLFAGFYAPYTSIYIGEAFPLRAKPTLMAVVVIVEQILQIIFIEAYNYLFGDTLITQGIITVILFFALIALLPETRNTTLTEAQRRFRTLFTLR